MAQTNKGNDQAAILAKEGVSTGQMWVFQAPGKSNTGLKHCNPQMTAPPSPGSSEAFFQTEPWEPDALELPSAHEAAKPVK